MGNNEVDVIIRAAQVGQLSIDPRALQVGITLAPAVAAAAVLPPPAPGFAFIQATRSVVDLNYLYAGGTTDGAWWINRRERTTRANDTATMTTNLGYADLGAAWADRENLTYG